MKIRHHYVLLILLAAFSSVIWWWLRTILAGELPWLDAVTRRFTEDITRTAMYDVFRWLTVFGSKSFMVPFVIGMTVVIWAIYRKFRPALAFGLVVLGTHIANKSIKVFVARERPQMSALLDAKGYSFPSGHAMVSLVCYGLLAYFTGRLIRSRYRKFLVYCSFMLFALLIGFSRFIVNVHYPTDILGGWMIGSVILYCTISLYNAKDKAL